MTRRSPKQPGTREQRQRDQASDRPRVPATQPLGELRQGEFFARWHVLMLIEAVEEIQRLQRLQVAHV